MSDGDLAVAMPNLGAKHRLSGSFATLLATLIGMRTDHLPRQARDNTRERRQLMN